MRAALPAFLEELRPQVVLLLGGINNTWNVGDGAGFDRWLLQHSALAHFLRIVAARWRGTQRFRLEQKDASSLEVETADGSSTVHGSPLAAADDAALLAQSTRADLRGDDRARARERCVADPRDVRVRGRAAISSR
ncbi:MAG: hypothetical protein U1E76_10030 [Planctomycetota bacterium]